jgi:hypothetical protein
MYKLNFPDYSFRVEKQEGKLKIFDAVRKKFVVLTPEEWVRQHVLKYLNEEKKIPISLMAVEKEINYNNQKKRFDVLIYNSKAKPVFMVECKSPEVEILQDVFNQMFTIRFMVLIFYWLLMVLNTFVVN